MNDFELEDALSRADDEHNHVGNGTAFNHFRQALLEINAISTACPSDTWSHCTRHAGAITLSDRDLRGGTGAPPPLRGGMSSSGRGETGGDTPASRSLFSGAVFL